jgi:predicted Zn finger-like uncharacterized protein
MLIVCPNCTTSYQIDDASVGPAGRMVRCARCKSTWFATAPASPVDAFVDGVIAEAEAEHKGVIKPGHPVAAPPSSVRIADDFGGGDIALPGDMPAFTAEPNFTAPDTPEFRAPAIDDAPSLVPPMKETTFDEAPSAVEGDGELETFAARRRRMQVKRQKNKRSSRWTAIILVLLALNVALIGARSEVVRMFPQTASLFEAIGLPVNLRDLAFENVRITREVQDGVTILMIDGKIVSTASRPVEVPRLRFAARNASGQEIYTWTARPEKSILEPGKSIPFSSRLASPPPEANDVLVRFFNANDAMAGKK